MKKRLFSSIICILVMLFIFPTFVHADMGPKPCVNITFEGIENEKYYITLLSESTSTGPFYYHETPKEYSDEDKKEEEVKAYFAFRDYVDKDGFYFLENFELCNDNHTFNWGYYPPGTFKILLYFPNDNTYVISSIQTKYAFDSYYKATISKNHSDFIVTGDTTVESSSQPTVTSESNNNETTIENVNEIIVENDYDYLGESFNLLIRVIGTIAVEYVIALLFGFRKKKVLPVIIIVNTITQIILNIILNIINYKSGSLMLLFTYFNAEVLVIIIEAIIYYLYFKIFKKEECIKGWVAPVYSFVSNTVSFFVGILLACFTNFF